VPAPSQDQIPPRFATAIRWTAFGARFGFAFSMALVAADLSAQFAPPSRPELRPILFGLAGGTASLLAWRLLGAIFNRVGVR
jgi:hypothetical protein